MDIFFSNLDGDLCRDSGEHCYGDSILPGEDLLKAQRTGGFDALSCSRDCTLTSNMGCVTYGKFNVLAGTLEGDLDGDFGTLAGGLPFPSIAANSVYGRYRWSSAEATI